MGFGFKKAVSTFSNIKNERLAGNKLTSIIKPKSTTTPGKRDRTRKSKSSEGKVTKSVSFDLNCNRSVKIVPTSNDVPSRKPAATASKANDKTYPSVAKPVPSPHNKVRKHPSAATAASSMSKNSNSTNGTSSSISASALPTSSSNSTHKHPQNQSLTCISTNEEPAKALKSTVAAPASSSSSSSVAINHNSINHQDRVPSSRGLHSKNLSYGTIYCASKSTIDADHHPSTKVNGDVIIEKSKANDTKNSSKISGSSRHVFGLGGCDYGHGSIINGMKSIQKSLVATNPESICSGRSKSTAALKDNCSVSSTAEQFKAAGNQEYKRGRFTKAIVFYDQALALCPHNVGCHNNKAAALAALGKISEAVQEYLEVISRDPTYSRAHYQLGVLYTRLGQVDEARKHLKLSGHDQVSEAMNQLQVIEEHLNKLEISIKVEDWSLVLAQSSQALEAGANESYQVIAAKAEALFKLYRANEALETLLATKNKEDWIQSRKSLVGASRLLFVATQVYLYLGRFKEAVEAAEEAMSIEYSRESLMWLKKAWGTEDAYRAGNEYSKVGKYSKACAMYSQGLQYDPENGTLLCKRAACRSKLGQWDKSVRDSNAALESCPDLQEALLQRALAHARLGEWPKAQRDYSELIKLSPGDPTVLDSLFEMHMETEKGIKSCRVLATCSPET